MGRTKDEQITGRSSAGSMHESGITVLLRRDSAPEKWTERCRRLVTAYGVWGVAERVPGKVCHFLFHRMWFYTFVFCPLYRLITAHNTFTFSGRRFKYFCHPYNSTWRVERAVEISVARDLVQRMQGKRILEVGNVLQHYFAVNHCILDKYEDQPGIIKSDLLDFGTPGEFDCIICISTLEHIGWDETPREPEKALRAIEHLRDLLSSEGVLFVTVPLGYNSWLDRSVKDRAIAFGEEFYYARTGKGNTWRIVSMNEALLMPYGAGHSGAGALLIGVDRPGQRF